jgi:D-alanyl-D-alanine carboxypeptidase
VKFHLAGLLLLVTPLKAELNQAINGLLEPIRVKHGLPAMTAAVFTTDGFYEQGTVGARKKGGEVKAHEQDLWHLGSNTKAMTATLAATFVAEGKLHWNDPVGKHFPEIGRSIDPALRTVTVADLLAHRGGLVPNLPWAELNKRNLVRARRDAAKQLLTKKPASAVGEFEYSNAGYVVVGSILENLGGKPWEDLLQERIFKRLGITTAGFGGTGTTGKIDQPWPHLESGKPASMNGPLVDNAAILGPAGTVHMTARDWSRFLADQLKGASGNGLLPAELYATIQSAHPATADYGLGWGTAKRPWAGGKAITHAGSNTMNMSVCWLALPRKFGVLVCTNQAGDAADKATDEAASELIQWYQKPSR